MEDQGSAAGEHLGKVTGPPETAPTAAERLIQEGVRALAAALTSRKEEQRQAAVLVVRDRCLPEVQSLVIDRLVAAIKSGRRGRGPAMASLVQLSPLPVPALVTALKKTRQPHIKIRVLVALSLLAPRLDGPLRFHLRQTLLDVGAQAKDDGVRRAIANLIAELGPRLPGL